MIDTNRKTYTDRVVRGDDGVYRWQAPLNREQQIKVVKIVFGVCGGLCVLFILGALILDPSMLTAVLLSTLAVLLIAGLPCWLYLRGGEIWQKYEMSEERLHFVGYGRSDAYYDFKAIRKVRILAEQNLLEVRTALSVAPFFVPHEDFAFVQDYVLRRLPDTVQLRYD